MFWDDSDSQVEFLSLGTGLVITGNTLSLDGDLEDISGLTPADGAVIIGDGADFTTESGSTLRASLGVSIGSDVLAYDANLQAFADAFTAPTTDGADGQYLKTDGNGVLSFATPAGAGDLLAAADETVEGDWAFTGGFRSEADRTRIAGKINSSLSSLSRLELGAGKEDEGNYGLNVYLDSFSGWGVVQNAQPYGQTELAVQPRPAASQATSQNGTDNIVADNAIFGAEQLGRIVYFGDSKYRISAIDSSTQISVEEINGSSVSFSGDTTASCIILFNSGTATVDISDAGGGSRTLTRTSGDPFVPTNSTTEYRVDIGGTEYDVASASAPSAVTVSSAGAVTAPQTGVTVTWYCTPPSDLMSVFRVHRLAATTYEENVQLGASLRGWELWGAASGPDNYPFYIGTGYAGGTTRRTHITLDDNGDTLIGGPFDQYSMRIASQQGTTGGNAFYVVPVAAGSSPELRVEGGDTNIDLTLTPKGSGSVAAGGPLTASGNVTSSGVFLASNGSVSAPAYSASGDTNTGIYFSAGAVNFAVDGGLAFDVTSSALTYYATSGVTGELKADVSDQRAIVGAYFEGGVGQYAYLRASDNAETGATDWRIYNGSTHNFTLDTSGNLDVINGVIKTGGVQVVGARVVDASLADTAALTAQTLTDNSGGSASDTIAAIGATYSQSEVANAVASLADEINKLRSDSAAQKTAIDAALTLIRTHGLGSTS